MNLLKGISLSLFSMNLQSYQRSNTQNLFIFCFVLVCSAISLCCVQINSWLSLWTFFLAPSSRRVQLLLLSFIRFYTFRILCTVNARFFPAQVLPPPLTCLPRTHRHCCRLHRCGSRRKVSCDEPCFLFWGKTFSVSLSLSLSLLAFALHSLSSYMSEAHRQKKIILIHAEWKEQQQHEQCVGMRGAQIGICGRGNDGWNRKMMEILFGWKR